MNKFVAYAKLLRLPGLGGLAIPPVFGAISVEMYDFSSLIILFFIGCCQQVLMGPNPDQDVSGKKQHKDTHAL